MPDVHADRLAPALDEIRAELRTSGANYIDTGRLLAAVEAVLKLHVRRDNPARTRNVCMKHVHQRPRAAFLPEWRKAVDTCPDCTVTEKYECDFCRHECPDDDEWPCMTYAAITAALTGSQPGKEAGNE